MKNVLIIVGAVVFAALICLFCYTMWFAQPKSPPPLPLLNSWTILLISS
jgi:hypothetical protein